MYQLLDSGDKLKLEAFGAYKIIRPCSAALWPKKEAALWAKEKVNAIFTREEKGGWLKNHLPPQWQVEVEGVKMLLSSTDFGHLGLFPEHLSQLSFFKQCIEGKKRPKVLNLFAYSGLSSCFLAKAGCFVTHVDASKPVNLLAKENAALNALEQTAIRWITDDVIKFIEREHRRGNTYDGILLDPPSFGRGSQGQVFKIEDHLARLVQGCLAILSDDPAFFLFTNHTPGFTPLFLERYFERVGSKKLKQGVSETGEMVLGGSESGLPLGSYYRWHP